MSATSAPTLTVTPAEPNLGARVDGVDITSADDALVAAVRALLVDHHVLVLPGQDVDALTLEGFARRWGDLLTHPATRHEDTEYIQFIPGSGAQGLDFGTWHSDMTWHPTPPKITMLHARLVPESGGDTCFANQHLAYETLPDRLREVVDGARAFHSGKIFGPDTPDSIHPAVRTHDESDRKALYLNMAFTRYLVDVERDLSKRTILQAIMHATRVEFVYRHKWDVHDLVIWDNRSVMHCPVVDYEGDRFMHRAVVAGDVPV